MEALDSSGEEAIDTDQYKMGAGMGLVETTECWRGLWEGRPRVTDAREFHRRSQKTMLS